jgi:hypothetical protein
MSKPETCVPHHETVGTALAFARSEATCGERLVR